MGENITCGYSMSTIWRFDHLEKKYTLYRGKKLYQKVFASLKGHAKKHN